MIDWESEIAKVWMWVIAASVFTGLIYYMIGRYLLIKLGVL